jgi:serine/threonine-protein kinase HipA
MTISRRGTFTEAFVWVWLPEETEPVVAGRLGVQGETLVFNYGRSYLDRENAIALYAPELPLQSGQISPLPGLRMPGCIRDASPDAWGRRVILGRLFSRLDRRIPGKTTDVGQVDELTYLLHSGSDRIGALDFQHSATVYEPRSAGMVSLEELLDAAERVEKGLTLSPALDQALHHGTSIGGARPKALVDDPDGKRIAKFSSSTDLYAVLKAEFVAMRLAQHCGLDVAGVRMTRSANKDVLLIDRFDRVRAPRQTTSGWRRKAMVSALAMLALDEMMARYASYEEFAELIRHRFTNASATLRELYARLTFNILVGNTDDHARNHSAFWDGRMLTLTPAYDICPQGRTGREASQAMLILGEDRLSKLSLCLDAAHLFLQSETSACNLIGGQIKAIGEHWRAVCDEAGCGSLDEKMMWGRQFLNPFAFEDLSGSRSWLRELAEDVRNASDGRA